MSRHPDVIKSRKYIRGAAYPVLKIECTGMFNYKRLDITIKEIRHTGMSCVDLVREYIAEYEHILKPMVFVLKQMVYMANLNDPFTGGINSYGLILMVVAFLQSELKTMGYNKEYISQNLGTFFLNFLNTYGNVVDYQQYDIRPSLVRDFHSDPKPFIQKHEIIPSPNISLVIQDPLYRQNNVTRSTFAFYIIRVDSAHPDDLQLQLLQRLPALRLRNQPAHEQPARHHREHHHRRRLQPQNTSLREVQDLPEPRHPHQDPQLLQKPHLLFVHQQETELLERLTS